MSTKKDKDEQRDSTSSNGKPLDSTDKPECFVIMPISDPEGYDAGHFRRVYEDLFVPACDKAGFCATRADQVRQTNLIHLDVLQKIINSPMALCDLSSRNPNVLFELGLRQAFDKPVVLVQEVGTPPIFDINPLRYTNYRKEMSYRQVIEDQQEISDAIKATKEDIGNSKSINSIVKLLSLTQPASLTSISEVDKDSALLHVIMNEIGNLRAEIKNTKTRRPFIGASAPLGNFWDSKGYNESTYYVELHNSSIKNYDILKRRLKALPAYRLIRASDNLSPFSISFSEPVSLDEIANALGDLASTIRSSPQ
jgi:hypothetical protein